MVFNLKTKKIAAALLLRMEFYFDTAQNQRTCPLLDDLSWIHCGISRCIKNVKSGRDFLQSLRSATDGKFNISRQHWKESLDSKRRLSHIESINKHYLEDQSHEALKNNPTGLPKEFEKFHIFSADGHFHGASAHESRDEKGRKHAIGHLYAMNMRNQLVSHLALSSDGTRKKPHDMGTLKKMEIDILRQGAKKGERVLYVWDRACIDFPQWMKWKQQNGIYFLTRTKENMEKSVMGNLPYDKKSASNSGVISNQLISGSFGYTLRMITYEDLETGVTYEFITNLPNSIEPGIIVQLYRMRWDIEKVFDEFKNKFEETKAWAKGLVAKKMQAAFIVMSYNLLREFQREIEEKMGIEDEENAKKRKDRWEKTLECYEAKGVEIPEWLIKLRRVTQIGVKFIRWVRRRLFSESPWDLSMELLRYEYSQK